MNGELFVVGRHASLAYPIPLEVRSALTPSELQVACMLADGLSNDAIAAVRRASVRTVANQIATLYRKLGVRCRRECALRLYGGSLVPIERCRLEVLRSLGAAR